jgi:pimeloyl-ACP methyl ester carboxylesterase
LGFRENGIVIHEERYFTGEPTLLLVHGTFSTPAAGFSGWLGGLDFAAVHARYRGRCLAFAHPTMHASPDENIERLFAALPSGKSWTFDTVSHSRGGLVARALAAHGAAKNSCKVSRVVMVAPPNFGTPLAESQHWATFLNAHTNLLVAAPDTVSTIIAEGVLCLVKILGSGAAHNLPGLAAMNLAGDYLPALARRAIANPDGMFAVAAVYEPTNRDALKQLMLSAADVEVDRFFEEANDLAVPTLGCSEGPDCGSRLSDRGQSRH